MCRRPALEPARGRTNLEIRGGALVDRLGQTRLLLPCALGQATLLVVLVLAVRAGVSLAAIVVVVVLLLYVSAVRLDVLRVGDWFVLGYAGALVLAASVVMTREVVGTLRAHVTQNLGVKT